MRWNGDHLSAVDAAIGRSDSGRPTALLLTGYPGMGKTALLDEVARRATGFSVLRTECLPASAPEAFATIGQLGVDIDTPPRAAAITPPLAGQRLRALLDDHLVHHPTLVVIDDLQWADPESVDVLLAVMERAEAEQLLLAIGTRPMDPTLHASFQQWAAGADLVRQVVLNGLDAQATAELLASIRPTMTPAVAESLRRHTGGNPLYLRALAEQYDDAALGRMRVLPAPAEFATWVASRVQAMTPTAVALARAVVVLSESWSSLRAVVAVAEPDEPPAIAAAVDELVGARIVRSRSVDTGVELRPDHSLVRSALYQDIALDERNGLHLRAAAVVTGIAPVFEHRLAATLNYDEDLAADLDRHASERRQTQDFASAARFLRFAASVTPDPIVRERRWLDSLIDSLSDRDYDIVRRHSDAVAQAADRRLADLVLALLAMWGDWRPYDAVLLLEPWTGDSHTDVTQYRVEALLAWARLTIDAAENEVRAALDRAEAQPSQDVAVARMAMLTRGQLVMRHTEDLMSVPVLATLSADPRRAPVAAASALALRGTIHVGVGRFDLGAADLVEVTERMQLGSVGFNSGWWHAVLGRAQWFSGDWARSRLSFRAALDLSEGRSHPLVVVALPMQLIGEGDLDGADRQIAEARAVLEHAPWREAVDQLAVVEVARAHAGDQSPGVFDRLGGRAALEHASTKGVMWLVHVALAAVWRGDLASADTLARLVETKPAVAAWTTGAVAWIRGLSAEATGDARAAVGHLATAAAADLSAIPLYRAHVLVDHARLVHLARGADAARRSFDAATAIYETLGARSYLDRMNALHQRSTPVAPAPQIELSERERDVLTLAVAGLSYAQIARDLFITQRTVGFHLGNIYAKSNVTGRHQLVDLARSEPATFGLPELGVAAS